MEEEDKQKPKLTARDIYLYGKVGGTGRNSTGVPPEGLDYTNDGQGLRLGEPLVTMVPSLTGGALPITYSITAGALPSGVSISATNGYITGTPDTEGAWSATVTATNSVGSTDNGISGDVTAAVNELGLNINVPYYWDVGFPFRDFMKQSFSWQIRDPSSSDFAPASLSVDVGSVKSGDVNSLVTANDSDVLSVNETATSPGLNIGVDFSSVIKPPSQLQIRVWYSGTHTLSVQVYNETDLAWDSVGTIQPGTGYVTRLYSLSAGWNYVDGSDNAQVRFYLAGMGDATHNILLDYVSLQKRVITYNEHDDRSGITLPLIAWGSTGEGYPDWTALKALDTDYQAAKRIAANLVDSFPVGLYTIYWDGFSQSNAVKLTGSAVAIDSGAGWGSYLCNDGAGNLTLRVEQNDAGDPVRNIRIMCPDESDPQNASYPDPGSGDPVYRTRFIQRFVDWLPAGQDPTVRLYNACGIAQYAIQATDAQNTRRWWIHTWADRHKTTDHSQFETSRYHPDIAWDGWAIEHIVALGSELNAISPTGRCRIWVNLPHQEEDPDGPGSQDYEDYVTGFATYLRNNLPFGCTVIYEYSNEIWNSSYRPYHWIRASVGLVNPSSTLFQDFVAAKVKECFDHILAVYSGSPQPYQLVFMGQTAEGKAGSFTNGYTTGVFTELNVLEADYVSTNISASGCAFYVAPTIFTGANPPADVDELMDHLINDKLPALLLRLKEIRTIADTWGVSFYAYEGGVSIYPNGNWQGIARKAHFDGRMYDMYDELGNIIADPDVSIDIANHYAYVHRYEAISDNNTSGTWGVANDLDDEPGVPPDDQGHPKLTSWLEWPKIP